MNDPIRVTETDYFGIHKAYHTSGTPVDCVKMGMFLSDKTPDLVLSGINHGSNVATNVLYSGTMSAAVEGALEGVPSIGFSLCDYDADANFLPSEQYVKQIIENVLTKGLEKGVCLNVNIPKLEADEIKGVKLCRQARAYWDDTFDVRKDPLGKPYYWLTGSFRDHDGVEGADILALESGYVTVVPTQYDMTAHKTIDKLKKDWEL